MEIRNHIYKFEVDNKETGKYIKRLRKEKGWTAEVLAEKLYCSPKTVSSWETGVRMPSLDMLVSLCNLFNVSVHSVLLPCDNCPCDYIGAHADASEGSIPDEYSFWEGTDEGISQLYIREEYLLQRMASKVFNQKDMNELFTISKFIDSNVYPTDPANLKIESIDDYEDALIKWTALRIYSARNLGGSTIEGLPDDHGYTLLHMNYLFRRLYGLNDFTKTLKAINIIEKSIILTTCIICKKIRTTKFAEDLYNAGALFIKGSCKHIPSDIQELLNKEPDYLNEYHDEKDFYVEVESIISPGSFARTINEDMYNYNNIMNYVTYVFYKQRDKKLNDILEVTSEVGYLEYLKKLEGEGQINA